MGQARHIPVLLIGLGNAGSGSCDLVATLLAPAGYATSTAAAASALASLLEGHRHHVGSATPVFFWRIFPLGVVIALLWLRAWYRRRLHDPASVILRCCSVTSVGDHFIEREGSGVELAGEVIPEQIACTQTSDEG